MKNLIASFLALVSGVAFGATLSPITLLNPSGSNSGQVIVSTGASTAPAWGGVGLNGIAAVGANTLIGNATGSTATPTAIAVTGCNGAAQALQWTNGTGFACNSSIATSGTNANITGLSGLTSPVALPGVTNGSAAASGMIGQLISNSTTGTAITSGTTVNATSVGVPAGDWNCWGNATFIPAATTVVANIAAGLTTTSATLPASPNTTYLGTTLSTGANGTTTLNPTMLVENVSGTTTLYLVAEAGSVTTSTASVGGYITCRRIH